MPSFAACMHACCRLLGRAECPLGAVCGTECWCQREGSCWSTCTMRSLVACMHALRPPCVQTKCIECWCRLSEIVCMWCVCWCVSAGAGPASSWAQEFADNEGDMADWDNIFARNAEVRDAHALHSVCLCSQCFRAVPVAGAGSRVSSSRVSQQLPSAAHVSLSGL
jgi:hypothetical protein